ncbi:MAG: histidine phosphatase family protein [Eubacteriales bacterium]|nr:histidine phosphatase family protein [Eubacteriales bacterium]
MITRLILVRHAEAEGNFKRKYHGWTDSGLTPKGHLQAKKLAERLTYEKIDVIYSSSLSRTLQTAGYIAQSRNLTIHKTDKLKELNGGDWENQYFADLKTYWPEEYEKWEKRPDLLTMPNGESVEEFQNRLVEEIENIRDSNSGKSICIVTHGTAIRTLICYFNGIPLSGICNVPWDENTSFSIIEFDGEKYRFILQSDASHLGDELGTIVKQSWFQKHRKELEENSR